MYSVFADLKTDVTKGVKTSELSPLQCIWDAKFIVNRKRLKKSVQFYPSQLQLQYVVHRPAVRIHSGK